MILQTLARVWIGVALLLAAPILGGADTLAAPAAKPPAAPDLSGLVKIASGFAHSCAVSAAGALYCWGRNDSGQLGDGTFTERDAPEANPFLTSGVTAVAAGENFTCAIVNGGAQCWGSGFYGQLGAGTGVTHTTTPVPVSGLGSGVMAITAGQVHACAILTGGAVKCWGDNYYGEVGNNAQYTDAYTPAQVAGLTSGASAIASRQLHTCAIIGGGLQCWGHNFEWQLGSGTSEFSIAHPVAVAGLSSGVTAVATGEDHSCAVKSGSVYCWGNNNFGQLGTGDHTTYKTAVDIGLSGVASLGGGHNFTCAILTGGGAKCWGSLTGDGTGNGSTVARDVAGLSSGVSALDGGYAHACALHSGSAVCWGNNAEGQLGTGAPSVHLSPVAVIGLASGAQQLGVGSGFACAITAAGGVVCWGDNAYSEIGLDPDVHGSSTTPVAVSGVTSNTLRLAPGDYHMCALMAPGDTVKCWGNGREGELGNGVFNVNSAVPVTVTGLANVQVLKSGYSHTCAIVAGGALKCWGMYVTAVPTTVTGLGGAALDVAPGAFFTCAVVSGGAVKCWGNNDDGQLGIGVALVNSAVPTDVVGLSSGVSGVAAGWHHACALLTNGHVKCWGDNSSGQLGDGTLIERDAPVDVPGLTGVTALAARGSETCARLTNGAIKCWGVRVTDYVVDGILTEPVTAPADVPGLGSGNAAVSAGFFSNCVLTGAGAVKCWGLNSKGELGNGESAESAAPILTSPPVTLTLTYTYLPLLRR